MSKNTSWLRKYRVHIIIGIVAVLLWVGSCLLLYFTLKPRGVSTIKTDLAPKALGFYSAARTYGDLIFVAGQIGVDPAKDALVSQNISEQTTQAMTNLKNIIEAAGGNMKNVLTTTIYLNDNFLTYFTLVNDEYGKFFSSDSYPARATMAVKQLPLKN